jgi:hypothetical protein
MAHRNPAISKADWEHPALAPVVFLEELKRSLEHTRRFTVDMQPRPGDPYANKVAHTEAEIEAWLIERGYWISDEAF